MSDPLNEDVTEANGIEVVNLPFQPELYDNDTKLELTPNKGLNVVENDFKECTSVEQLLYQLAGATSMSWENVGGAGRFDDVHATKSVKQALEQLVLILETAGVELSEEVLNYNE